MSLTPADFKSLIAADLLQRGETHQLRSRRRLTPLSATRVRIDQREYVNFASNDYLGLTHHPRLIAAAMQSVKHDGTGSGAAPLITGYSDCHAQAEAGIAHWKQTEDAVLLPSGYQANHAVIQTLASLGKGHAGGLRFLIDKLVHASLLDAIRGAQAEFRIFPHNHLGKVKRLVADASPSQLQVVVTESIFSMDGDAADLHGLADLKRERPFFLLVDEAHGGGVYGPGGAGYAAEINVQESVDATVVTLSKAMGCIGGAVCGSKDFCNAVVNHGRAYIFSTAPPPFVGATAIEAIAVMRDESWRQKRVRELARRVRDAIARIGLKVPPGDSPILPILVGESSKAVEASMQLAESGLLVVAVRPLTVPRGTSRLRVTLCCEHTDDEVARLLDCLAVLKRQFPE